MSTWILAGNGLGKRRTSNQNSPRLVVDLNLLTLDHRRLGNCRAAGERQWLPAWCQDLLQGATRTRPTENAHEPLAWQKDDEFKHRRNHVSLSRMQGA